MKRAEKVLAISAGILLFLSAGAWAQPVPPAAARSATGQKSASAKKKKREKTKKWHGQLVDATCISKAMNTVSASALHGSDEGAPNASGGSSQSQFIYYSSAPRQTGRSGNKQQIAASPSARHGSDEGTPSASGGSSQSQSPYYSSAPGQSRSEQQIAATPAPMGSNGQPMTQTPAPGNTPVVGPPIGDKRSLGPPLTGGNGPSINTAAMQKGAMLEHAAKECTATSTTSQFGLLTDSGAVMKFGKSGNSKAIEAVKQVELKPKKPVKATVRGLEGSKGRFLVTSVAVKGKHKK